MTVLPSLATCRGGRAPCYVASTLDFPGRLPEVTTMDTNKQVALRLSQAIMKGDWALVDTLLDDTFVYVGDGRPALSKAEYVGYMRHVLCVAMKDMVMTFPRVVAEGDLVAVEYTNSMTHAGPFLGLPATGRRVTGSGHFIREVKGGKVTAEWQTTNAAGLMAQLGASSGQST